MSASQKVYVVVKNREAKVDSVSQCVKVLIIKGIAGRVLLVFRVSVLWTFGIKQRVAGFIFTEWWVCVVSLVFGF